MRAMPTLQRDCGFTLLEMIFSVVLIGVLAAVGSTMIADSFTTTRMVNAGNVSEDEARYVVERLAREIREVKFRSTDNLNGGYYCIDLGFNATHIAFDKRNITDPADPISLNRVDCSIGTNKVTIDYSTPNLNLSYASPALNAPLTSRVVPNANNVPLLSYLKIDGMPATTSAEVYFVVITLTLTDATSKKSIAQRVRVALRNS